MELKADSASEDDREWIRTKDLALPAFFFGIGWTV
jgi:hypothetical protein